MSGLSWCPPRDLTGGREADTRIEPGSASTLGRGLIAAGAVTTAGAALRASGQRGGPGRPPG